MEHRRRRTWSRALAPTRCRRSPPDPRGDVLVADFQQSAETVALGERQAWFRGLRILGVLLCAGVVLTDPAGQIHVVAPVWPAIAVYSAAVGAFELMWAVRRRLRQGPRELWLLGAMLLLDAAVVVWLVDATGGLTSPLRYLAFVQVVAVVLLASYRTGVKLAAWYCLLFSEERWRVPASLDGSRGRHQVLRPADLRNVALGSFLLALVTLTLVAAAAAAISERELRRRRTDLESLAELAGAMEHVSEPEDIGRILVEGLRQAHGLTRLVLVGPGPEPILLGRGAGAAVQVAATPLGARSVVTIAAGTRAPQLVRDLDPADDPWLDALLPGARNLVAVPLTADGGCLGVLVFEYDERAGTRLERRMLAIVERFTAHTALSLRNARLLERVRRVAAVDGLTAIPNRRTFEEELERETVRAERTGEPVSLFMIDIDHFKVLNDTHGHQTGDDVLRRVAQVLRVASRDYDVVARYGGEEFAVILPACDRAEAARGAERLLAALRTADAAVPVTASLGHATYPDDASSARRLVDHADQALYAAKRGGRDRVAGYHAMLAEELRGQIPSARS